MHLHQVAHGVDALRVEVPADFDSWCALHGLQRYRSDERFRSVAEAHAAICTLSQEPSGPGVRARMEQLSDDILEHMAALSRALWTH